MTAPWAWEEMELSYWISTVLYLSRDNAVGLFIEIKQVSQG